MTGTPLCDTIRTALHGEWWRSIREQIEDSPDGHIDRLTDAIMGALGSEPVALALDDARRLFDLATDSPLLCSGSFETDDVVVLRRLATLIGVNPALATPDEFAAQFPHPFARRQVHAEPMTTGKWLKDGRIFAEHEYGARWHGRMETVEEQRARMAEERADETCQAGAYGRRCAKPADDPIHTAARETAEMGA